MKGDEPLANSRLPHWFERLGAIAAALHRQARDWQPPQGFRRKRWTHATIIGAGAFWGDWRRAPGLDAAGRAVLERADRYLAQGTAAYGTDHDRFGLVHGDMRTANLLVDGDRLGVIDFDDCGYSWFGYDFAAAVSFMEDSPLIPDLMAAWVEGYRRQVEFAEEHVRALPMLVLLRRMQLTAWIGSHPETPTARALAPTFAQGTVALAESFLTRVPARV